MELPQHALELIWRLSAFVAALLIAAGATIEPDPGAWLWAVSASFLAVAVRRDRSIPRMMAHLAIGTVIGIALAALLSWKFGTPRAPVAFLISLFGVDLFIWFRSRVKDGSFIGALASILNRKGK